MSILFKTTLYFSLILILTFPTYTSSYAQKKEVTLEDIFKKNVFPVKKIEGIRSMKNGVHYSTLSTTPKEQCIVMYEYKTGNAIDTILKSSWLKSGSASIEIDDYQFSSDENKILISSASEKIYRHSTKENYYIYDRKNKTTTFISSNGKQMYAELSPNGDKIGFVRDNNLFVYDIASAKETAVTEDGKWNHVINGATDWVYEEEFSFAKGWFWSPDGSKISYYRFDESNVKEYSITKFESNLYPLDYTYKYPKAGEENSKVDIYVYNVSAGSKQKINLGNEYEYIPRIKWTNSSNLLSIQRMNRLQNKLDLLFADVVSGNVNTIISENSATYIEISDNLTFLPNGSEFIWSSENDGYNHLYLYNMSGKLINQITKGNWDVINFYGYDDKTKSIFYTSSALSPANQTLFSCKVNGSNVKQLFSEKGTDIAEFNSIFSYYILNHSDANTPPVTILCTADGKTVRTLENNSALTEKMKTYSLTRKELFSFKSSQGIELYGWKMLPQNFDATKKYPVLMFVYGGPGKNTVNDMLERDYWWYQLLCSKGYIVVSVDNRGTQRRGRAFRECTYKQMGKLETEDQMEAAKYLGTLPYVDKSRIGIWGWSYGGFMASSCIFKGADIFKAAIAVAPVTNWRYYDNVYTERYMGLPQDNASGYDQNSPINFVNGLKGKFLLVHGTADDNVHFQNSIEMSEALINANKQFDFFVYPDRNHSMAGGKGSARLHLYTKLTNFILENL
ncbi:MAG TPA: S9 family peptidase [Bacteroidia bacterium]|nr:S9 family peptidase [Bacteroidia bacterium]